MRGFRSTAAYPETPADTCYLALPGTENASLRMFGTSDQARRAAERTFRPFWHSNRQVCVGARSVRAAFAEARCPYLDEHRLRVVAVLGAPDLVFSFSALLQRFLK